MDVGDWAFSCVSVRELPLCAPPLSPAGEPTQMVPGRDLPSFPKLEMEAGTCLGGSQSWDWKPDIAMETGSHGHCVIRASWWLVLSQVLSPLNTAPAGAWFPFPISQHSFLVFQGSPLSDS